MTDDVVVAVDPGRSKCGLAAVDRHGVALARAIVSAEEAVTQTVALVRQLGVGRVVLGDGTGGRDMQEALAQALAGIDIRMVDERRSSEEARIRFLADHPPQGWRKFLPRSLFAPDSPYDDYVAIILAERWWSAARIP